MEKVERRILTFHVSFRCSTGHTKKALLLHLGGHGLQEIMMTYPAAQRGDNDDYDKAIECLDNHFKLKKNSAMARQVFLNTEPKKW